MTTTEVSMSAALATTFEERNLRQREIVPSIRLRTCHATVVGCGAIGRQVALQLASTGVPRLQLVDFDMVEPVNLGPQMYLESNLGDSKVEATAEMCRSLNSEIKVDFENGRFRRSMETGDIIFCCVDTMEARKLVWESVRDRARFFCDGRMNAEVIRILTAADPLSVEYYPTTLFSDQEAYGGSCTARSTVFSACIAAGLMVGQFTKFLRRLPLERDTQLNLLAMEMSTS